MKTILSKICSILLCTVLICSLLPISANASFEIPGSCLVQTDTGAAYRVKTLDYAYGHNTYYSLRDIAMALKDTDKAFSLEITKDTVSLNTGNAYVPVGGENVLWENNEDSEGDENSEDNENKEYPDITLRRNKFNLDGQSVNYYTLITRLPSGYYDCFLMAADLGMILDVNITVPASGSLQIHTQEPFSVSPASLEQAGYFYGVNSVLVGDATTGELYYQYQSDVPYPIASTSKLMTYLLTMDAISAGQLSFGQQVTISDAVQLLSDSGDGVLPLEAGTQITVRELLLGILLPSSNECALCLAESIAGSEEAFVQMMNQKAVDIGLSQAVFFNSHGLPSYTEDSIPSKRQNRMSAEDMFRLTSYLLRVYPQITDITSLRYATLESLDLEVRNTNPLLYNLPEVTGLKTGTTNRAGACLVTSLTAHDGFMEHDLIVVVFGTEDSIERGRVSGLLARYALHAFYDGIEAEEPGASNQTPENLPVHAEAAVDWILRTTKKQGFAGES